MCAVRFEALLEELEVNVQHQYHEKTPEYIDEIALYLDLVDVLTSNYLARIIHICTGLVAAGLLTSALALLSAAALVCDSRYVCAKPRPVLRLHAAILADQTCSASDALIAACRLVALVSTDDRAHVAKSTDLYARCAAFVIKSGPGAFEVTKALLHVFADADSVTISHPFCRVLTPQVFSAMFIHSVDSPSTRGLLIAIMSAFMHDCLFIPEPEWPASLCPSEILEFCCAQATETRSHGAVLARLMSVAVQMQYHAPTTFCPRSIKAFLALDAANTCTVLRGSGVWKIAAMYAQCMLSASGHLDDTLLPPVDLSDIASRVQAYSASDMYIMVYDHVEVLLLLARLHRLPERYVAALLDPGLFEVVADAINKLLITPNAPVGVRRTLLNTLELYLYFAGQFRPEIGLLYAQHIQQADRALISRLVCPSLLGKALLALPAHEHVPGFLCKTTLYETHTALAKSEIAICPAPA
ncbi:hypothetical protein SARC_00107 [Sphaeroforma arctica JP610]|uniref:Uncharacterized protein n=1 Tax=Sphaeroforma arctica JP610 TaxID=667725 RepID=A0A0L0GFJ5_9EUKA|nr:hypothetical protein SARC_00107 [Sphaeroforma arctica JP610]KNC87850.1 hypothetical protein SARC_00107 [Sphaeroforma arctica JP610]|eukprot:XP_014161752.1 hypothetical protein SARC_00107 [Sphaeroforma arctica JP610]